MQCLPTAIRLRRLCLSSWLSTTLCTTTSRSCAMLACLRRVQSRVQRAQSARPALLSPLHPLLARQLGMITARRTCLQESLCPRKVGRVKAAQQASHKCGVLISASTARRAAQRPGEPPKKPGPDTYIPSYIEHKLESLCLALRELNLPIFRFMVLNYVNVLIRDTAFAERFKDREVRRDWYYNWLSRCKRLSTANIRPLEMTRAQWCTPENVQKHYDMVADIILKLNLGVRVEGYDPSVPYMEELKITRPDRIASLDETRLTNDTTTSNKSKANRSLVGSKDDTREAIVNKGGGDGTGIGGGTSDGKDLPGFYVFANNILHAGEQDSDVPVHARPVCRRVLADRPTEPVPCRFWANAKGGMTGDLGVRYIRGCIEPSMPDLSPENPGLLILDGHGSHFTLELLLYWRATSWQLAFVL